MTPKGLRINKPIVTRRHALVTVFSTGIRTTQLHPYFKRLHEWQGVAKLHEAQLGRDDMDSIAERIQGMGWQLGYLDMAPELGGTVWDVLRNEDINRFRTEFRFKQRKEAKIRSS